MIDIIDLTQEEYQNLNSVQLAMVRAAQAQKDQILAQAEQKKEKAFYTLLKHNVARNTAIPEQNAAIDLAAEKEIDVVREDLVYRLAYSSDLSGGNELRSLRLSFQSRLQSFAFAAFYRCAKLLYGIDEQSRTAACALRSGYVGTELPRRLLCDAV